MKAGYLYGIAVLLIVLAICAGCTDTGGTETPAPTTAPETTAMPTTEAPMTIVETAAADGRFTTLVAAVDAAGLTDTLNGPGPFTVFAPTDDAFAALPNGTIAALLEDPEGLLTEVLTFHVVSGRYMAADVVNLDAAPTVQGANLTITVEDGDVMVDGARVVVTDIEASNGVIHVIDAVMLPPTCHLTVGTSEGAPDHQHVWCEGAAETLPFCNDMGACHTHPIDEGGNMAEAAGAGPHTHDLT
ncbi:fasciclin domain-containing protein [Methanofollis fontis]|uniref:FAS1 domain-containing protein n=1 Tax=Methanofollis fontis TaxID=2052832 RepID=A0A483CS90_9EURY|nr:fasciclin domain-containing protein [Methanofollis fontis]TAJ43955.1 hypothetical protein CUJ86_07835 [Methanofollis fontis]